MHNRPYKLIGIVYCFKLKVVCRKQKLRGRLEVLSKIYSKHNRQTIKPVVKILL